MACFTSIGQLLPSTHKDKVSLSPFWIACYVIVVCYTTLNFNVVTVFEFRLLFLLLQALIRFKNFFYFEEKDDLVEEFEKVWWDIVLDC